MIDEKVLLEESLQLPITYKKEVGFKDSTGKILSGYIKLLKSYRCDDEIIKKVSDFRKYYMQMMSCYYRGQHAKAYQKFKTSLKQLDVNEGMFLVPIKERDFYRARICDNSKGYALEEMWHIPFDKRGIVKTERFSFPGLPCLYFGASAYSCWIEMNCPEYNAFQVAHARCVEENIGDAMIFDISITPSYMQQLISKGSVENINTYLLLWPVIAMSMVQVSDKDAYFKPEYIFPQFLMEYISSGELKTRNVIGIKYASTKVSSAEQYNSPNRTYACYVFPTSTNMDRKYDDIRIQKYFKLTGTISGTNQNMLSYGISKINSRLFAEFAKKCESEQIYVDDKFSISYDSTRFCEIEFVLKIDDILNENK